MSLNPEICTGKFANWFPKRKYGFIVPDIPEKHSETLWVTKDGLGCAFEPQKGMCVTFQRVHSMNKEARPRGVNVKPLKVIHDTRDRDRDYEIQERKTKRAMNFVKDFLKDLEKRTK